MNWSRHTHGGRGREHYHHGNLREALIEAALALIAANGPLGFTFAEAARHAGVSPAAPYRHFRDRDELLADVARIGFERFAAELSQAWNDGAPEPVTAFCNIGKAYLAFARGQPGYYAAMFAAGVKPGASAELDAAGDAAFAVLRSAADIIAASLPKDRRPPALMVALHMWSLAHGVASLFGGRNAASRSLPMSPEDLLEAGALVYLQGLGLAKPREATAPS
jgi:AcrR family transcriptional regulator